MEKSSSSSYSYMSTFQQIFPYFSKDEMLIGIQSCEAFPVLISLIEEVGYLAEKNDFELVEYSKHDDPKFIYLKFKLVE